jgi:hypothetical protein
MVSLPGIHNTQNNWYWSSQNPHLAHGVQLDAVKAGVWCDVYGRIVGPVFFNETVNCERFVHIILRLFLPELTEEGRLCCWLQQDSAMAHTAHISMQALSDVFGGRIISSVFGEHIHPILTFMVFSSGVVRRTEFTTVTPEWKQN